MSLTDVESAIETALSAVEPLEAVKINEPAAWTDSEMPLAWLRWTGPVAIVDAETGDGQDVTHGWELELVVDVPPVGRRQRIYQLEDAQERLKTVVQAVTAAIRDDPTFGQTVDSSRLRLRTPADFFQRPPSSALYYGLAFDLTATLTEYP